MTPKKKAVKKAKSTKAKSKKAKKISIKLEGTPTEAPSKKKAVKESSKPQMITADNVETIVKQAQAPKPVEKEALPPPIDTHSTEQLDAVAYGNSILSHINISWQMQHHGAYPIGELRTFISTCSDLYEYEIKNDGSGSFIALTSKTGVSVRVPATGYLKLS